jgi:hypothetical protein
MASQRAPNDGGPGFAFVHQGNRAATCTSVLLLAIEVDRAHVIAQVTRASDANIAGYHAMAPVQMASRLKRPRCRNNKPRSLEKRSRLLSHLIDLECDPSCLFEDDLIRNFLIAAVE